MCNTIIYATAFPIDARNIFKQRLRRERFLEGERGKRKTVLCSRERSSAFERVKNPFGRALLPPLFIGHEQQQIRSNTYSITVHRLLPRSTATISLKPRPTGRFSSSIAPRPATNRSRSYVRRQFTIPVTLDEPIADFVITMNVFKPLCTDTRDFRLQGSRIRLRLGSEIDL